MKELINFFFETGMLKRAKRSGWWLINVKDPENIAEHSFRTAVIGYFLAKMEKVDVDKVVKMCLFHDLAETRVNDSNKVSYRYVDHKEGEKKAGEEQLEGLKGGEEVLGLLRESWERKSKEAIVAKDADEIECALQAKEYMEQGYKDAQNWIDNARKGVKSPSAKKLMMEIEKTSSNDWWRGLKKLE